MACPTGQLHGAGRNPRFGGGVAIVSPNFSVSARGKPNSRSKPQKQKTSRNVRMSHAHAFSCPDPPFVPEYQLTAQAVLTGELTDPHTGHGAQIKTLWRDKRWNSPRRVSPKDWRTGLLWSVLATWLFFLLLSWLTDVPAPPWWVWLLFSGAVVVCGRLIRNAWERGHRR